MIARKVNDSHIQWTFYFSLAPLYSVVPHADVFASLNTFFFIYIFFFFMKLDTGGCKYKEEEDRICRTNCQTTSSITLLFLLLLKSMKGLSTIIFFSECLIWNFPVGAIKKFILSRQLSYCCCLRLNDPTKKYLFHFKSIFIFFFISYSVWINKLKKTRKAKIHLEIFRVPICWLIMAMTSFTFIFSFLCWIYLPLKWEEKIISLIANVKYAVTVGKYKKLWTWYLFIYDDRIMSFGITDVYQDVSIQFTSDFFIFLNRHWILNTPE